MWFHVGRRTKPILELIFPFSKAQLKCGHILIFCQKISCYFGSNKAFPLWEISPNQE